MCKLPKVKKKRPEWPYWHRDIKKHWHRSSVFIVNFEKIPHFFLVFQCCICGELLMDLATEIKVQTTKNYEICKDRWKLCHANQTDETYNPASYLKSMQNVGFEKTSTKFLLNFFCCVKMTCL